MKKILTSLFVLMFTLLCIPACAFAATDFYAMSLDKVTGNFVGEKIYEISMREDETQYLVFYSGDELLDSSDLTIDGLYRDFAEEETSIQRFCKNESSWNGEYPYEDNIVCINAIANDVNVFISFDGYATNEKHAVEEAKYLIEYLNTNIPKYINEIELSIVYNLYTSSQTDVEILKNIIDAFEKEMKEEGYNTIVELGKTKFSTMDLQSLVDSDIGLYVIWRPYVPDFKTQMSVLKAENTYNSDLWSYRTDAYFGEEGINKK